MRSKLLCRRDFIHYLQERFLPVSEVALKSNVSKAMVWRLTQGEAILREDAYRICEAIHIEYGEFFCDA